MFVVVEYLSQGYLEPSQMYDGAFLLKHLNKLQRCSSEL